MVFATFVKHAKAHSAGKPQFFESSYPYLRNHNALVNFEAFFQRTTFGNGGPHPSNTSSDFFGIDNGHYGLYFTIFNHEGDKRKIYPVTYEDSDHSAHQAYKHSDERLTLEQWESFYISKAARETSANVKGLHLVSKRFLPATQSSVKPSQFLYPARLFSTTTAQLRGRRSGEPNAVAHTAASKPSPPPVKERDTFADDFIATQTSLIRQNFESSDGSARNMIFPIYQSIKRNDLVLPSIDLYNIVLASITSRPCDGSNGFITEIESRLTNLLTVYQDLIALRSQVKPNDLTYKLVLEGLFQGCYESVKILTNPTTVLHSTEESFIKGQEFLKVATDLFMCTTQQQYPDLMMTQMVSCLRCLPNLLSPELFDKIKSQSNIVGDPHFHIALVALIPHIPMSKDVAYQMSQEIFANFKECHGASQLEYAMYGALVETLIRTKNTSYATKFVDDIMNDYKAAVVSGEDSVATVAVRKSNVSHLLSSYLTALSDTNLMEAHKLMEDFGSLAFVPEFSVGFYKHMIGRLLQAFHTSSDTSFYQSAWKLHDSVSIRKDYYLAGRAVDDTPSPLAPNANELLISLSIDLGDHERVFFLIKQLILKNMFVKDFNIFRKLVSYLYNGAYYELGKPNLHYFELMWSLIESQAGHYSASSNSLNYYLSGVAQFIKITEGNQFSCVQKLVSSNFVRQAFSQFRLDADNSYGIMIVSRDLMSSDCLWEDSKLQLMALELQSHLIVEFEDTESFYLELAPDILEFKDALKTNFKKSVKSYAADGRAFTGVLVEACKSLDYELPLKVKEEAASGPQEMRLALQLNVNPYSGLRTFIKAFQQGYVFDYSTWKSVLNKKFVTETLQLNDIVKVDTFVQRLRLSSLTKEELSELLVQMVELGNERVNILYTKILSKGDLMCDDSLMALLRFWETNENYYLNTLITENFEPSLLFNAKDRKRIIGQYFSSLSVQKRYADIIAAGYYQMSDLNLEQESDLSIAKSILNAHLELHELETFDKMFRQLYRPGLGTASSTVMNGLLLKFCTYRGSYDLVLKKFASALKAVPNHLELLHFNHFLKSLNGSSEVVAATKLNPKEMTLQLMSCLGIAEMKALYDTNKAFIEHNKDEMTHEAMEYFHKAANIMGLSKSSIILHRFQTFLAFLKLIHFTRLDTRHLVSIIEFYGVTGRQDLANIILNKIAFPTETGQYGISPLLDYYFFEVPLYASTKAEVASIFQSLYKVFSDIKDYANTDSIHNLCEQHNLVLKPAERVAV
ncbi:Uncharacterized protein ABC855_g3017 [[Candida] zeylanoides]